MEDMNVLIKKTRKAKELSDNIDDMNGIINKLKNILNGRKSNIEIIICDRQSGVRCEDIRVSDDRGGMDIVSDMHKMMVDRRDSVVDELDSLLNGDYNRLKDNVKSLVDGDGSNE